MIRHVLAAIAIVAVFMGCDGGSAAYTNGTETTVHTVEAESDNRDNRQDKNVIFVMDGSGSMSGTAIEEAKRSMATIIQMIDARARSSGEVWNVSLIAFDSHGISERVGLKPLNKPHLLDAINRVDAGSSTPLGSAMKIANDAMKARFKKQNGFGSYTVIVVTDGAADTGQETRLMKTHAADMARNGYNLQVIGYNIYGGHILKDFATGYREAGDDRELVEALSEALAEFSPDDPNTVQEVINFPQDYKKPTRPGA